MDGEPVRPVERGLRRLAGAVADGRAEAAAGCFAGSGELVAPQGRFRGHGQVADFWHWALDDTSLNRCEVAEVVAVDDHLATQAGTLVQVRGELRLAVRYALTAVTRPDGQIVRLSLFFDRWDLVHEVASQSSAADAQVVRRFVASLERRLLEPQHPAGQRD